MKVLIDTNILISAFVFGGTAGKLFNALLDSEIEILVSEYVDSEFKEKLSQKWPEKAATVYELYHTLPIAFCKSTNKILGSVRDKKDVPVLSDAIFNNADVLLTGDNDFLDSNIEKPLIFSPKMMLEFLGIAN